MSESKQRPVFVLLAFAAGTGVYLLVAILLMFLPE